MSFHPGGPRCPRGRGGHGARPSAPAFRPQNLRLLHPQQPPVQYQYEPPSAPSTTFSNSPAPNFLPPRPDFVPFPPPMPPSAQGPLPPCPIRPPYSHHSFPPPNFSSFQNSPSSFPPSASNSSSPHFRHLPPYPLPKAPSERRSPERLKHYDDHRHAST